MIQTPDVAANSYVCGLPLVAAGAANVGDFFAREASFLSPCVTGQSALTFHLVACFSQGARRAPFQFILRLRPLTGRVF